MGIEAAPDEVLSFIAGCRFMGKGIGYVDIHLMASAVLTGVPLWRLDRKLAQADECLHINHGEEER
jgi:hypothetical protein